jgi:hypothetical protein
MVLRRYQIKFGEPNMMRTGYQKLACVFMLGLATACATKPAPVTPPIIIAPPPPPPPRPYPPGGAASTLRIPVLGVDGVRVTPNRGLSTEETVWNYRSAINVAAVNCRGPIWDQIAANYNKILIMHKSRLAQSTKLLDGEYKKRFPGENALRVRDSRSTELYNYFALPPIKQEFCDTALRKTQETLLLPSSALPEYSVGALVDLDGIFIRFFNAYAQYETDLAAWNQRYAPVPTPVMAPSAAPFGPTTGPVLQPVQPAPLPQPVSKP